MACGHVGTVLALTDLFLTSLESLRQEIETVINPRNHREIISRNMFVTPRTRKVVTRRNNEVVTLAKQ
jgi:hypothetical protein